MKRITLNLIFALLLIPLMIFSKNPKSNGNQKNEFVEAHLNKLHTDVQLTDSQEIKIREYLEDYFNDRQLSSQAIGNDEKIHRKNADYEKYCNLRDSVLTAEQRLQLKQLVKQRKEAGKKKKH